MKRVGVGLLGSRFVSGIHAEAFKQVPRAEIVAVASRTEEHAKAFAEEQGIPRWFTDYHAVLEMPEVQVVVMGIPNYLHAQVCIEAAQAGKHVICEKPLCITLEEADRMIAACREAGVLLMYAEELCFTPKYVRAKQLVDEQALGDLYLIKQAEKHDGPHSPWFWDVELSGGGVTMDMGCHAFEYFRWMLGKERRPISVYADMGTFVHSGKTKGDDDAVIIVEFEGGVRGVAEESWAKPGGMDDRAEIYGSQGVIFCDLLRGSSFHTYSSVGYGYAVEKAAATTGWSFTMYEELWNYGFPQEMAHFIDCVADGTAPLETGEDGRAVMEMVWAAYESAGTGRKVALPFTPPAWAKKPIDLWINRPEDVAS